MNVPKSFGSHKEEESRPSMTRRQLLTVGCVTTGAAACRLALLTAEETEKTAKTRAFPSDITQASATAQADLIQTKQITPLELAELVIAKIKRVDEKVTAVEHLAEGWALEQAEAATKAIAGGTVDFSKQRLFGVLFGVKDSYDVAGMPTRSGAPSLRDNIARRDATVVRRLRNEGAIPVVKTRLPMFGFAHESINLYGWARNPYDLRRSAGGSSGGAAALSASGATPFDIGSDGGASIRNPAHCCGVAGLVPAYGRVSIKGVCPPMDNNWELAHLAVGPIARWVEDLVVIYDIIAGVDPHDPFTWPLLKQDARQIRLRDMRIGYWAEAQHTDPTPETVAMVEEAAKALQTRGAKVTQVESPVDPRKFADIWFSSGAGWLDEFFRETVPKYGAQEDPLVKHCRTIPAMYFAEHSAQEIARLKTQLPGIREKIAVSMEGFDAILTPVKASPALPHLTIADVVIKSLECHPYTETYSMVFSLPSGTVRCSTSPEGLPLGVHVVGSPAGEHKVLAILDALEKDFGGWRPSPLV